MNNGPLSKTHLIITGIGVLLIAFSVLGNKAFGQELLRLQHRHKPNRIKTLRADMIYELKTDDSLYYSRIIGLTESSIKISGRKYSGRDTTVFYPYYGHSRDTLIKNKIYIEDTLEIAFNKFIYIKKSWFRQPSLAEPFGWLLAGGVIGIAGIPFTALYKGGIFFTQHLAIEAGIFAISIPMVLFFQGHTKYDMKNKWRFYHDNLNPTDK